MKTRTLNKKEMVNTNLNQTIKSLNKAEFAAWGLFIGVGILYILLSLIVSA